MATAAVTGTTENGTRQEGSQANMSMEEIKKQLDKDGVAVLPGVLTEDDCDGYVTELHEWLAKFGPRGFPDNIGSILHKYNVGHHQVPWQARLKVAPVFESLWGTKKLLTSFDGMAIGQPPELGDTNFIEGKQLNLHLDQGPKKLGLHAYQGAVYLEDADEDDWCFAVMNGSHKYHSDFFNNYTKKPRSEFLRLTQAEVKWYEQRGCYVRRVAVPKGGIVLWDSRTVHAGAPPSAYRENHDRWRYVVFICMAPAAWATDDVLQLKRNAYHNLMTTRHWPARGFDPFRSKKTPPALNAVNKLPEIARTERAQELAGVLEYNWEDGQPIGPPLPKYIL